VAAKQQGDALWFVSQERLGDREVMMEAVKEKDML
jgi:hypothetical protein